MLFVGRLEQLNARQREQRGVIDELLDRPAQELEKVKYDPVDSTNLTSEGSKYVFLIHGQNNFDKAKAKEQCGGRDDQVQRSKMYGRIVYVIPPPASTPLKRQIS